MAGFCRNIKALNFLILMIMNANQKMFLAINIIGGILVIGSYYFGLRGGKGVEALWGGVPENIRPIYTISMLLCAVGYFIFFSYIISNLGAETFKSTYWLGEKLFLILFALILVASALWMPLVNVMVSNPSTLVWVGIRIVLAVVALASLAVVVALLTISPRPTVVFYYSAVIGMIWFTIHTGILDALIWPYLWGK
jgi:hypothetical protein